MVILFLLTLWAVLMRRRCLLTLVLLSAILPVLAGCGDSGPKLYSVKGKITINGQPAKDIQVNFHPTDPKEPIASSQVAADGTYELRSTSENRAGAVAGTYKVVLTQMAPSGADAANMYSAAKPGEGVPGMPAASFPAEYLSAEKSPKQVEVKSQANVIDIEI